METQDDREWKEGSAELLILSLVEDQRRPGYDISKLTAPYPLLYRLEKHGWMQGRWVEKSGQRRRRYYRLTPQGRKALAQQRQSWQDFVEAVGRIAGIEYA